MSQERNQSTHIYFDLKSHDIKTKAPSMNQEYWVISEIQKRFVGWFIAKRTGLNSKLTKRKVMKHEEWIQLDTTPSEWQVLHKQQNGGEGWRFGKKKMSQIWRKSQLFRLNGSTESLGWLINLRSHSRQHPEEREELLYRNRLPRKQWKLYCHWISQWSNVFKAETEILTPAKSAIKWNTWKFTISLNNLRAKWTKNWKTISLIFTVIYNNR